MALYLHVYMYIIYFEVHVHVHGYGLDVMHQIQSTLMMAQGRNTDPTKSKYCFLGGRALVEATKDV